MEKEIATASARLTVVRAPADDGNDNNNIQTDIGEDVQAINGVLEVVEAKIEAQLLTNTNRNMYWEVLLGLIAFNFVFRKHMRSILTEI